MEETEETVINLKQSLSIKKQELEQKEKESNEKLNLMMKEKFEATEKKKNSELLQEQIKVQNSEIMQKKESVNKELAEVEPALEDAKKNVKNLDNKSLRELQSYK